MKNRWTYFNKYIPFTFLFLYMCYFHFYRITEKFGDDLNFQKVLNNQGLFSWLKFRYFEWSSRTFIEIVLVMLARHNYAIWKILNILVFVLLAYAISYLFSNKDKKQNNWYIVLLILAYPINQMASAGWIATTVNYLWPLTFGLISFFPIKKYVQNLKIHWFEYPIYLVSLLFACNVEQMAAVVAAFYFIFTLYMIAARKFNTFIFVQFICSILSILYIILSPGNSVRNSKEIIRWFTYFADFSLVEKFCLGFSTTISLLLNDAGGIFSFGIANRAGAVNNLNFLFLILSILLPLVVYKRTKSIFPLIIAFVPLASILFFNMIYDQFFIKVIQIGKVTTIEEFNKLNFGGTKFYLPVLIGLIIIASIIFSLFKAFIDRKKFFLVALILLAGIFSRVIMGFSPTIFASSLRTAIFLYCSLIICNLYLIKEIRIVGRKSSID